MIFVSSRAWAFLASWYSAFSFRSPKPRAVLISSAIAARAGPSSSASAAAQRLEVRGGHLVVEILHAREPSGLDPVQPPDATESTRRRDRRRRRARRPGRHRRARRRRPPRDPRRPGARGVARRAGVLVARRAVPRRHPRAAPAADPRLARARAGRTGSARPASTAPRTSGRAAGREAYVDFAAGEKRAVAARAGHAASCPTSAGPSAAATSPPATATRCRASTSPGAPAPACSSRSCAGCATAQARGLVELRFRHRVDELIAQRRRGDRRARRACSSPAARARGAAELARRPSASSSSTRAGRDRHLGRHRRQPRAGARQLAGSGSARRPRHMISGVPDHVDGRMLEIAQAAGGNVINPDRMWHYTEGIHNWDPIWSRHGIRILPGPSSLWLDARGRRLPRAAVPRLRHARHARAHHGHGPRPHLVRADPEDHREGVRALGLRAEPRHHGQRACEQVLASRLGAGAPAPVEAFKRHGADFVVERDLRRARARDERADRRAADRPRRARARDRRPRPRDRRTRTRRTCRSPRSTARAASSPTASPASPRRTASSTPTAGPLIAVRLSILTRKTLGGLQTDLSGRVLTAVGRAAARPLRRRRGGGLRRRRHARLPRARGHVPRRLPVLGPDRGARGGRGARRSHAPRAGSRVAWSPSSCSPPSC